MTKLRLPKRRPEIGAYDDWLKEQHLERNLYVERILREAVEAGAESVAIPNIRTINGIPDGNDFGSIIYDLSPLSLLAAWKRRAWQWAVCAFLAGMALGGLVL